MSDSLQTYLHDHLAGANFAVDLVEFLRDEQSGTPVGELAAALLPEVEQDRQVLRDIIAKVGDHTPALKAAAASLVEKVSRAKLRPTPFGIFEALETLSLGILGKLALWKALATIATADSRVQSFDFGPLISRAQQQHSWVEEQRVAAALAALTDGAS